MVPVVNGLEVDFDTQVEFRRIDANDRDGRAIFLSYGLRGHPSYVILNQNADVLWRGLGERPQDVLEKQIRLAFGE